MLTIDLLQASADTDSCFVFTAKNLSVLWSPAAVFSEKALETLCTLPNEQQTAGIQYEISELEVKMVEKLAASLRCWRRPNPKPKGK